MIVLAIVAWLVVGYAGFVWWWSRDFRLEPSDALFGLLPAVLGPVAWVAGRSVHRALRAARERP